MDPDAALFELRERIADALHDLNDTTEPEYTGLGGDVEIDGLRNDLEEAKGELADAVGQLQALDQWICKGGFLPLDWRPAAPIE